MNKLIWEGKPSHFSIHCGGSEGIVLRETGKWEETSWLGNIRKTKVYDEFLKGFQGDVLVFDENDYKVCEVESTCEYYDYDAHFERVTRVEQTEHGDLHLTVQSSIRRAIKDE